MPLHLAPRLEGVGSHARGGAVSPLVLLEHPLGAAEILGAAHELVDHVEQVGDVGGGVLELGLREGSPRPVGIPLGLGHPDVQHPKQQRAQALAGPQPDEAGDQLGVEQGGRPDVESQREQREVRAGGVHHDFDGGVREQRGDVVQRAALDRVDEGDLVGGGHLGQAGDGRIGALPQELDIKGHAPVVAHPPGEVGDLVGRDEDVRPIAHYA